jgi:prepilin-type processing-associated H-X9-DG protein
MLTSFSSITYSGFVGAGSVEVKVGTRHSGGFVAVFCDGHAKWQPGPDKVRCGMWSIEAGD